MDTITTVEKMVAVVQEEQDKAIIESINKWITESSGLRSAVLINEDELREVILLGAREYEKIHGEPVELGKIVRSV